MTYVSRCFGGKSNPKPPAGRPAPFVFAAIIILSTPHSSFLFLIIITITITNTNTNTNMIGNKPSLPFRSGISAAAFTSIVIILDACKISNAFTPTPTISHVVQQFRSKFSPSSSSTSSLQLDPTDGNTNDWISLTDNTNNVQSPVRKRILTEGAGNYVPSDIDSTIEIQYTGTLLGERNNWSTHDVVQCWLSQLQGLDYLSPQFLENEIDGIKLMDESFFTEQFCMETLGMENKIQAKKIVMASRRLSKQQVEYPAGTVFDSSDARDTNYTFVLKPKGSKVIPAMELAVRSMKVGERSHIICRSDYAYGSEGYRSSKGEVVVPPFAMLCFDMTLVNVSSTN